MTSLLVVMLHRENDPYLWLSSLVICFSLHVNDGNSWCDIISICTSLKHSLISCSLFLVYTFGHFPSFTAFQGFIENN